MVSVFPVTVNQWAPAITLMYWEGRGSRGTGTSLHEQPLSKQRCSCCLMLLSPGEFTRDDTKQRLPELMWGP